ncbi:hypothetical protein PROFUN_05127 [Planoprotostelium fungivorum]|uniref:Uncharacterized protein n=1 Tax=Planoprotostelium fungivorum TaxID=1890364 RepID=A0A2P6NRZ9_9EUKA|nr:hypothetical protein PROFUN_05127 [Planoprotostelium fungivorum]
MMNQVGIRRTAIQDEVHIAIDGSHCRELADKESSPRIALGRMSWPQTLLIGLLLVATGHSTNVYNRNGQCSEQIIDFLTPKCWDNGSPDRTDTVVLNNMSNASMVNNNITITQLVLNNTHLDIVSSDLISSSILFDTNSSLYIHSGSNLTVKTVDGDGSLTSEGQVLLVADIYGPPSFTVSGFRVTRLLFSDMQLWNISWSVVINASRPISIKGIELKFNNRSHGQFNDETLIYSPSGFEGTPQVSLADADACNELVMSKKDENHLFYSLKRPFDLSSFSPVMADLFIQESMYRYFSLQHANVTWLSCYDRAYQRVYSKDNLEFDPDNSRYPPSQFTFNYDSKIDPCTENNVTIDTSFQVRSYGDVNQTMDSLEIRQTLPFVAQYSPYNDLELTYKNIDAMTPTGDRIILIGSTLNIESCNRFPDLIIINDRHHLISRNTTLFFPHCSVNQLNYTFIYGPYSGANKSITITPFLTPRQVPRWQTTVSNSLFYPNPRVTAQLLSRVGDCDVKVYVTGYLRSKGDWRSEARSAEMKGDDTWLPIIFHEKTQWNTTVTFTSSMLSGNLFYRVPPRSPPLVFDILMSSDYPNVTRQSFTGIPSTSSSSSSVVSTTSRDRFTLSRLTEIGSTAETAEEKWDDTMDWWAVALPVILLVAIVAGVVYVFYKSYLEKKEKKGWIPLSRK